MRSLARAFWASHGDYNSSFDQLLARAVSLKKVHQKNLQGFMIENYKAMNNLNPSYIWEIFVKKDITQKSYVDLHHHSNIDKD